MRVGREKMVSGGNCIAVGFCLSSGEAMYMFNIPMYICSCTHVICNMHVHGEIPADPSMTHIEL